MYDESPIPRADLLAMISDQIPEVYPDYGIKKTEALSVRVLEDLNILARCAISKCRVDSLGPYIDAHARNNADVPDDPGTFHMVRAYARMAGLNTSFLWLLIDMVLALRARSNELKDQEKVFWTVKNRPPNYHARIIALRTARVYAREKGERPKFGTLRDGGAPSTSFARALERVFEILEIKAGIRGPAQWAIAQLNDADLEPMPRNALADLMSIGGKAQSGDGRIQVGNALAKLAAKRSAD